MIFKRDNYKWNDEGKIYNIEYNVLIDTLYMGKFNPTKLGKIISKLYDIQFVLHASNNSSWVEYIKQRGDSDRYMKIIDNRKYYKKVCNRLKLQIKEIKKGMKR